MDERVLLTDEGPEILRHSESMMAAIENFRQQVNQVHKQLRGEFNIGIINNLVTQLNMKITDALRTIGKEVRLNISMMTAADIERGLMDGRLYVGAQPLTSPISGLDHTQFYDEKSYLYCISKHPLFTQDGTSDDEQLGQYDAIAWSFRMTAEAIDMNQVLNCTASEREGIAFLILIGRFRPLCCAMG